MDWLTIDSAPKDGSRVLLAKHGEVLGVGDYWTPEPEQRLEGATPTFFVNSGTEPCEPSHWMPIPEPPK